MEAYKISNTLEVLFNIKKEDSIQITSFSRAPSYKEGNEEYLFTLRFIRGAEKTEDKPAETLSENTAEKAARDRPAGIIIP